MFVAIDMDNLRFTHKHHDHETVSAVSYLELGTGVTTRIEHAGDRSHFLMGVTDLDVRMLYKNTTGQALPANDNPHALRHQLADVVGLLGATRALREEAQAQVDAVEHRIHDGERFRYALGAKVPAQPGELFPLKGRALTERELQDAAQRAATPVRGYSPRPSGQPARPWDPDPVPAPAHADTPPPVPSAPAAPSVVTSTVRAPRQSVRPVVRAAADKAWADAGKPTDHATLKQLTNALVPGLEADGYHRTTIRIKLSEWVRERAADGA